MKPTFRNRPASLALLAAFAGACATESAEPGSQVQAAASQRGLDPGRAAYVPASAVAATPGTVIQPGVDSPLPSPDVQPARTTDDAANAETKVHDTSYTWLKIAAQHVPGFAQAWSQAMTGQGARAGTVDQPAEQLRQRLTYLLREHVYLSGQVTAALFRSDLQALFDASQALDENAQDLTSTITEVRGGTAGGQFRKVWSEHLHFYVDYALATAGGDETGRLRALQDLQGFSQQFAQLVDVQTGGTLPEGLLETMTAQHVSQTEAVIDAQAQGNAAKAASLAEVGAAHMDEMALMLSTTFATQRGLQGDAASGASGLQAQLTALLTARVYQVAALTDAVIDGRQDEYLAWSGQIEANQTALTTLLAPVFGQDGVRQFEALSRTQLGLLVRFALGVSSSDTQMKRQAQLELDANVEAFARFLVAATDGKLTLQTASGLMAVQIQGLSVVIEAQGQAALVPGTATSR